MSNSSGLIKYSAIEGSLAIEEVMPSIGERYMALKRQMLDEQTIKAVRQKSLTNIRHFLATLNQTYQYLKPEQLEAFLANQTETKVSQELPHLLQTIASNSSKLLENKIQNNSNQTTEKARSETLSAIAKIYDLYRIIGSHKNVSIDAATFMAEAGRLLNTLARAEMTTKPMSSSPAGFKETGNFLGHIGALVGAEYAREKIGALINDINRYPGRQAIVYDTGNLHTMASGGMPSRKITTDTLVVSYDINENGARLLATLGISDKFNAKYRPGATSTGRPVKLATRTITTFLAGVKDLRLRQAYQIALMNYLSYHVYRDDSQNIFQRLGYLPNDQNSLFSGKKSDTNWNTLRRAIGAEMLYHEISTGGKGKFAMGGVSGQIEDRIDLYLYGDKIFLADDILKSKRGQDFNLAQISLYRRNQLLKGSNIQSMPVQSVLKGEEDEVVRILSMSNITYSQTISFI